MAKSFINADNPALEIISGRPEAVRAARVENKPAAPAPIAVAPPGGEPEKPESEIFGQAVQHIEQGPPPLFASRPAPPDGWKVDMRYVERRNKRVPIMVTGSIHEKLKQRSSELGLSVSEYVFRLIERDLS